MGEASKKFALIGSECCTAKRADFLYQNQTATFEFTKELTKDTPKIVSSQPYHIYKWRHDMGNHLRRVKVWSSGRARYHDGPAYRPGPEVSYSTLILQ